MMVYELESSQCCSNKPQISRPTLLAMDSWLTSSPNSGGVWGLCPGPRMSGVCYLQHVAFKVPLGTSFQAEPGEESRDPHRRFLWVRPGSGVHTSLLPCSTGLNHTATSTAGLLGDVGQLCARERGAWHGTQHCLGT